MRLRYSFCLLVLAFVLPLPAQQVPSTLAVSARLVVLDVSVTDDKGNLVTDLQPSDFVVFEDKQKQTVRSFQPPSAHLLGGQVGIAPGLASSVVHSSADLDKVGDAPVTLIVLDELNTSFSDEAYARERVVRWLSAQPAILPQPTFLLALDDSRLRILADAIQNRDAMLAVLKKHVPAVDWRHEHQAKLGGEASDILATTIGAIEQIAHSMRGLPGRKNLIWVGEGFPAVVPSDIGRVSADRAYANLRHLSSELLLSRVTFSVMGVGVHPPNHPDNIQTEREAAFIGLNFAALPLSGSIQFADLAAPTGGKAYTTNDIENSLSDAVRSGTTYYTLAYTPTNVSTDEARYRRIRVEVLRAGLHVQTRDGYYPVTARDPAAPAVQPTKQQLAFDLFGAAANTLPFTGIDVKVSKIATDNYSLTVPAAEMGWRHMPDGHMVAGVVILAVYLDRKGSIVGHSFNAAGSSTTASEAQLLGRYTTLQTAVHPPSNTANIRFVLRDTYSSRVGTVNIAR